MAAVWSCDVTETQVTTFRSLLFKRNIFSCVSASQLDKANHRPRNGWKEAKVAPRLGPGVSEIGFKIPLRERAPPCGSMSHLQAEFPGGNEKYNFQTKSGGSEIIIWEHKTGEVKQDAEEKQEKDR